MVGVVRQAGNAREQNFGARHHFMASEEHD